MIALSVLLMSVSFSISIVGMAYSQRELPIMTCVCGSALFFAGSLLAFLLGSSS